MLSTLETKLKATIKTELGFSKPVTKIPKFKANANGDGVEPDGETSIESKGDPLPEAVIDGLAKAIAKEVVDALKSGITIEGMISDLSAVHSGSLIGVGGGVPGPVTVTSGAIKASVGKIKITLGKIS